MRGSHLNPCSILIAMSQVLIEIHNGEHVWNVLVFILGNWALICDVDSFIKFELAGVPIRPFQYLDAPILIIACGPCTHAHDVHAQHDVTRFAYDANHVTMTSPAFAFHSCHVEMRWHDVIGVCITWG